MVEAEAHWRRDGLTGCCSSEARRVCCGFSLLCVDWTAVDAEVEVEVEVNVWNQASSMVTGQNAVSRLSTYGRFRYAPRQRRVEVVQKARHTKTPEVNAATIRDHVRRGEAEWWAFEFYTYQLSFDLTRSLSLSLIVASSYSHIPAMEPDHYTGYSSQLGGVRPRSGAATRHCAHRRTMGGLARVTRQPTPAEGTILNIHNSR